MEWIIGAAGSVISGTIAAITAAAPFVSAGLTVAVGIAYVIGYTFFLVFIMPFQIIGRIIGFRLKRLAEAAIRGRYNVPPPRRRDIGVLPTLYILGEKIGDKLAEVFYLITTNLLFLVGIWFFIFIFGKNHRMINSSIKI